VPRLSSGQKKAGRCLDNDVDSNLKSALDAKGSQGTFYQKTPPPHPNPPHGEKKNPLRKVIFTKGKKNCVLAAGGLKRGGVELSEEVKP